MIGKCCDGKHVNLGSRVHLKVDGYVVVPNVYGRVGLFFDSVYTACETPNDSALSRLRQSHRPYALAAEGSTVINIYVVYNPFC